MLPVTRTGALAAYHNARREGRRFVAEQNAAGRSGLLPILEPLMGEICNELSLGYLEIPLKKVRGTYAMGRSSAFAGNFMPLLGEETEFAGKWTALYESSVAEGIREPVKAYEYLGYYYIVEGNKRVSVLAYSDAYSVRGEVTRLMPHSPDASPEHKLFFEMLGENRRAVIGHMWFSRPGRMTKLRELSAKARKKNPKLPQNLLEEAFGRFRAAYHRLGFHTALSDITTGDAFYQYVLIYGFPLDLPEEELLRNIQNCRPMLNVAGGETDPSVLSDPSQLARRPLFTFFSRGAKQSVLFAYRGTPQTGLLAAAHDVGRYALARDFPSVRVTVLDDLPADCYGALSDAARLIEPDLLFATDPSMGPAALRLSLEARNTTVLHCHYQNLGVLGTYSAKTEESAFLMGALAGSLTVSGHIGYMRPPAMPGGRTYNMQAFAQGARLVRPAVRVYFAMPGSEDPAAARAVLSRWAGMGIDMACLPRALPGLPPRKSFPGVFCHLRGLGATGIPGEFYALSAWHWEAFYTWLIREILESSADLTTAQGSALHFRMGLDAGVTDTHPVYPALAGPSMRLLKHLRYLLIQNRLSPLDEDDPAEVVETELTIDNYGCGDDGKFTGGRRKE